MLNFINKFVGLPPFTKQDPDGDEFWGGVREESEDVVNMETQGKVET